MHDTKLILTLTGGLAAALVLGYVAKRLGLSPMVGYLLAGIAVGPHTPGFNADQHLAEQLAEVGIILLMFGVGLHFHLKELLAVRWVAVPGAIGQSVIATVCGAVVARIFGWDWSAGIVFGLALSVASTVVLMRVLADHGELHSRTGRIAVGWLIVEDLFTVVVLVLLPTVFGAAQVGPADIAVALLLVAAKICILAAFTFLVGGRVIPWLLERVAATRSRELFTLTILVVALGIAVGSARLFGVSMALGAFLAGMIVGRSDFSLRAASEALPMRDAFAVLFFVSVGMLFDPRHLLEAPLLIGATLAVILISKPAAALGIVLVLGYPMRVGLAVAVALAQIGEFSFILANLAKELGIFGQEAINTLVAAAIFSISINPLLFRWVQPLEAWLRRARWATRFSRRANESDEHEAQANEFDPVRRAVIVGFGPVGRTVARLLRQFGIEPTVIELNLDAVRRLREEGIGVVYGDAAHRDILEAAGTGQAGSLILSSAGSPGNEVVIRQARDLNPTIRVLARTAYVHETAALRAAGAAAVFSDEGQVAHALTEAVLQGLGATQEQIQIELERVRDELA